MLSSPNGSPRSSKLLSHLDFFVSTDLKESPQFIRYISMGFVVVQYDNFGFCFGGKRMNF